MAKNVRDQRFRCVVGADAAGGVGGDSPDAGGLHAGGRRGGRDAGPDRLRAQAARPCDGDAPRCGVAHSPSVGSDGAGAGTVGAGGARRVRFGGRVVGVRGTRTGGVDFGSAREPGSLGGDTEGGPSAGLSALLRVSRDVGAVLLGGASASSFVDGSETPWEAAARQSVADQLRAAAGRTQLPAEVVERLREASKLLGVEIVSESVCLERDDIGEVLVPGTRICFTGTAQDSAGRIVERWEMEQLAVSAGLKSVQSVSKTRCDVLVTAEAGTQSGKGASKRRSTASRCSPQMSSWSGWRRFSAGSLSTGGQAACSHQPVRGCVPESAVARRP